MEKKYIEALYNENRNAVPSWQGYHYQAQVATYYYLKTILNYFDNKENAEDLVLTIEWIEDFIITNNDEIKMITQVKKTLNKNEYDEVLGNFIQQYSICDNSEYEWNIIYDKCNLKSTEITQNEYEKLYSENIEKKLITELKELRENVKNETFWREGLKLKTSKQDNHQLDNIKHYLRKLMSYENIDFKKIGIDDFERFVNNHIPKILETLQKNKSKYNDFKKQIHFVNEEIENIDNSSKEIIRKIEIEKYIKKPAIFSCEDIVNIIYNKVYEKLMSIKNKKQEILTIKYNEIVEIFACEDKLEYLWDMQVAEARKQFLNAVEKKCAQCISNECSECIVKELMRLDLKKAIEDINLEYPKSNKDTIQECINNKLSDSKINYFVSTICKNKDTKKIIYKDKNSRFEIINNTNKLFLSAHIADPDDDDSIKINLIENIHEHEEIYREYNVIITKLFKDTIIPEDLKIVKDNYGIEIEESRKPKIKEIMPIKFVDKNIWSEYNGENIK